MDKNSRDLSEPIQEAVSYPNQASNKSIIEVKDLRKVYRVGKQAVFALNSVSFSINKGEFCAIVGTSGSGKSTLLNLLAGLEPASKGSIRINNVLTSRLSEKELVEFRRKYVGFIFQSFNLIASMTAWENVALPLLFRGVSENRRKRAAIQMLNRLGLKDHIMHKPSELSGGQQQRVGIARALVVKPAIVFADEPTGNLDSVTSREIMGLLQEISQENQQTLIMVTHDNSIAAYADRIFRISDGKIIGIEKGTKQNESFKKAE